MVNEFWSSAFESGMLDNVHIPLGLPHPNFPSCNIKGKPLLATLALCINYKMQNCPMLM